MNKISVLVVNINNLKYTKNCIDDLLNQTYKNFSITLIDQGSTEIGTNEYLQYLSKYNNINIIINDNNIDLNKLWNNFFINSDTDYLCYLNNDIRITNNFIEDTINILDKEKNTGIVIHTTNSFKYNKKLITLEYKFLDYRIKQGWDFTIRKSLYKLIPDKLRFYFGDDWLFHNVYENNYNVAICLSSPVIHYGEKSAKYSPINFKEEEIYFNSIGLVRYLPHYNKYNEALPTFKDFDDNSIETIVYINNDTDCNDIYLCNDNIHHYDQVILNNLNNITQYIKDNIKIMISKNINEAINNGYNKWGWFNCNKQTLPFYLEHLPNLKIIE